MLVYAKAFQHIFSTIMEDKLCFMAAVCQLMGAEDPQSIKNQLRVEFGHIL